MDTKDPEAISKGLDDLIAKAKDRFQDDLDGIYNENGDACAWMNWQLWPYLRMLREQASLFYHSGKIELAIKRYEELLNLNEGDNQGVRFSLMPAYVTLERADDAIALYERYGKMECCSFLTSLSVLAYKKNDEKEARDYAKRLAKYCPSALDVILEEKAAYFQRAGGKCQCSAQVTQTGVLVAEKLNVPLKSASESAQSRGGSSPQNDMRFRAPL